MPPLAWSAPSGLERIAYGEGALSYASGTIRESLPVDGLVARISGDNETTGNRNLLTKGDIFYIFLKRKSDVSPGDLYTIYRQVHRVVHPVNGRYLGNLFIMLAVVKVIEARQEPTTVKIVRSYGTIFPRDPVMRFVPPPLPGGKPEGRQPGGYGIILDFPPGRTLVAQRHVVFIDWGRDKALRSGDLLEVFRDTEGLPRRVIGELKVLAVGDRTSSALVTRSTYPYRRGDPFAFKKAAPEVVQEESPETAPEEPQQVASVPVPEEEASPGQAQRTELLEGLLDRVEFASGDAALTPGGIEILNEVSELLKDVTDEHIRVEGHTDNVEIGPTLKETYPTNWELSKARANEVLRYLVEEGGVDAAKLSAVGHAYTQPVASNADEEGQRKNRRVEIIVYSSTPADAVLDELSDSDRDAMREDVPFMIDEEDVTPLTVPEEEPIPPAVDEVTALPDDSPDSDRDPMMEDSPFLIDDEDVTPPSVPEEEPIPPALDEVTALPDDSPDSDQDPTLDDLLF